MLSDAEQRQLTEIERGLRTDDPVFVQRFDDTPGAAPGSWQGMSATGWLIAAAVAALLALLLRSAVLSLVTLSALGVAASLWATDDKRAGGDPPDSAFRPGP